MVDPSLSIVVPTHNGLGHLPRCLRAVRAHAPAGTQVIVVDDASTDGTGEWLARHGPWVERVTLPVNRGYCMAINAGIVVARHDVVELLNDDTEVQPGWAEAALARFADPRIGSVAPLVLRMDDPTLIDGAGQDYHLCGWARDRGFGRPLGPQWLTPQEVFGPSGSSGFYRRDLLQRLGGMPPEFEAYLEDVDLSFRMRHAGYACIYEPASRVLHARSASYAGQADRVTRLIARNEELVHWSNLPARQLWAGLVSRVGFLMVRTLCQTARGNLGGFLAAKAEALRYAGWIRKRRRMAQSLTPEGETPPLIAHRSAIANGVQWLRRRVA